MTAPSRATPELGHRFRFTGIGTSWSVRTPEPLPSELRRHVLAVVEAYDRTWSRFRADSLVARLAEGGTTVDLGSHAPALLDALEVLARVSGGAMTPLIGASLEHLGYDADYTLRARPGWRPAPPVGTLRREGSRVTLAAPAVLDVGSAGKGQLIDVIGAELTAAGRPDHVVDGGGDLRAAGPAITAALEHPADPTAAIGLVELRDAALCGSAVNRRSWPAGDARGPVHHVLDGRTGEPVRAVVATWVVAPTALVADALSTALFFVEPAALAAVAGERGWGPVEHVVVRGDGTWSASAALPGEVFR